MSKELKYSKLLTVANLKSETRIDCPSTPFLFFPTMLYLWDIDTGSSYMMPHCLPKSL
jgi:hypothetical protein